jgi:trehalose 6-phosphate synthase
MARLVIVSNRVPIPKSRTPAAGGLAVALADCLQPGSLWFGWSGRTVAESTKVPARLDARGIHYLTIDLSAEDHRRFYAGFANAVLWPLFHFQPARMRFRREDYGSYRAVNEAMAATLRPLLEADDLVWIHDYHLIPLGRALRALGAANRIGFFLHVPFVPASVFKALPVARELLADFGAYDLIGFQTPEHVADFRASVERLLGAAVSGDGIVAGGRPTRVIANPIGIDPEYFARTAARAACSPEAQRLRASLAGRALAIGVDRLDYSKGLTNRFAGIARLFERFPEHRRGVNVLQITARSREDVDEYRQLRIELDRAAGNVNGRFSDADWTPLRYSTRAAARTTLAGFYRIARVALVTPLRDGMNLVAKEFVAAQDGDNPGVLILSEFAGAAVELGAALLVNPHDPDAIADALHRALTMTLEERKARHDALLEAVRPTTAATYCSRFLSLLSCRGHESP